MATGDTHIADVQTRDPFFAPARRSPTETVSAQVGALIAHPIVEAILGAFSGQVLVLDHERQILAASPDLREALIACGMREYVGEGSGEVLASEPASQGVAGRDAASGHWDAVMAVVAAQCCGSPDCEECWVGVRRDQQRHSVEFRAKAMPVALAGSDVLVVALQDISERKRRVLVERSFLHDARNVLGSILMWSEILAQEPCEEAVTSIRRLALQMRDQLNGHRMLAQADKGDLVVASAPLDLPGLARALRDTFSGHACGEGKNLVVQFPVTMPPPLSDANLVLRILTVMVDNALEATRAGATVTVRFEQRAGAPAFEVHNPGVIPPEVAPRIFERHFSTKSEPGHGLGTYSMRLFAEQYLGGQVSFSSSATEGTTFVLTLPAGQG